MQPIPPEIRERNRELIAARTGWPPAALEAVRELEDAHPGYSVWWDDRGPHDRPPRPGYYARLYPADHRNAPLYGADPAALAAALAADTARREADEAKARARWRAV